MIKNRSPRRPGDLDVTRNSSSAFGFCLVLLCLYFLWFYGLTNITGLPIGNDEYNTIARIRDGSLTQPVDIGDTLDKLAAVSPDHGPLYFVLMNLWQRVAGFDLFSLRVPSVFFALLTLATAYRIARLSGDEEEGLAALVALAFLSFFLYYTHIARMYTLLALVSGVLVWSYWKAAGRIRARLYPGIWLLLFGSAALIMYIHYAGLILLAAIGLYHLLYAQKGPRWWRLSALLSLAALMFVFWLPVAVEGATVSSVLSQTRLSPPAALAAGLTVFSNGVVALPLIAFALTLRFRSRLRPAQRYILLILVFAVMLLLALNEITTLLVESRLRYLTFLAIPAAVALAGGLRFLPRGKPLLIFLLVLWIAASFAFTRSDAFNIYTNRRALREDSLVQYQAFRYDLRDQPGFDQLIVSFHQRAPAVWKTIEYYRAILDGWKYIVHLTYDESGRVLLQSGIPPRMTLDDIADDFAGIYAIHNPAQTDLNAMAVYRDWFLAHFRSCKRFINQPNNVIELYLRRSIPCELLLAENPIALRYDNGMALANIVVESTRNALEVYFWWEEILHSEFSFSLQLFDQAANKALGKDGVIWREPLDAQSLDVSALPPGDYTLMLIVYDFETGVSQPGLLVGADQRFEREVEIARISIPLADD